LRISSYFPFDFCGVLCVITGVRTRTRQCIKRSAFRIEPDMGIVFQHPL